MQSVKPFSTLPLKINTYIIEASSRNCHLDSLFMWLFLRALDVERNDDPTGRLYDIKKSCKRLSLKMRLNIKTVRRQLLASEQNGYCTIDADHDCISIPSKKRLTNLLIQQDKSGHDRVGRPIPNQCLSHEDIMECSITLSYVWHAKNKQLSQSRLLDIVRQRMTNSGYCRESFARVVGMDRTSTARMDRETDVKRKELYGIVTLQDLVKDQSLIDSGFGQKVESAYKKLAYSISGRGSKVWYDTHLGKPAIITQLNVQWITQFENKLKHDIDVVKQLNASSNHIAPGCGSPLEQNGDDGRAYNNVTISVSQRDNLTKIVDLILNHLKIPHNNIQHISIIDASELSFFGQSRHPNFNSKN